MTVVSKNGGAQARSFFHTRNIILPDKARWAYHHVSLTLALNLCNTASGSGTIQVKNATSEEAGTRDGLGGSWPEALFARCQCSWPEAIIG